VTKYKADSSQLLGTITDGVRDPTSVLVAGIGGQ
jgi:hypothetical protein